MRLRARGARTYRSDGRWRGWRYSGRGAQATALLAGVLVVMVCAAASASARAQSMTTDTASEAPARPAMSGAPSAEMGARGSLLPGLPALFAPASGAGGRASGTTIFYDGSEGSTSPWTVSGDPTWAITTYRAAAGAHSSYCAGSTIPAPGPYANNMVARRVAGPFDLSAVTSATFQYKVYFKTERDADWVWARVSIDGVSFKGWGESGDSQGWADRSRDLTAVPVLGNVCGQSQVWIAFYFESNPTVTDEGAYVDDVTVLASSPPTPTPTPTPTGDPVLMWEVGNVGAVSNGGTSPTVTQGAAYYVTAVRTYHWNNAKGAPAGQITLKASDGTVYGPWQATGTPGQGGVPNANWEARPQQVIPAGTYTVIDSDPSTWSQNSGTGGKGMCSAYGIPSSPPTPPPTPTELHWRLTPLQGPSKVHANARVRFTGWLRSTLTTGGPVGIARAGAYVKFRLAIPWEHFLDGKWQIPSRAWKKVFPVDPTEGLNYSAGARFKPGKWRVQATAKEMGTGRLVKSPYKNFTVVP